MSRRPRNLTDDGDAEPMTLLRAPASVRSSHDRTPQPRDLKQMGEEHASLLQTEQRSQRRYAEFHDGDSLPPSHSAHRMSASTDSDDQSLDIKPKSGDGQYAGTDDDYKLPYVAVNGDESYHLPDPHGHGASIQSRTSTSSSTMLIAASTKKPDSRKRNAPNLPLPPPSLPAVNAGGITPKMQKKSPPSSQIGLAKDATTFDAPKSDPNHGSSMYLDIPPDIRQNYDLTPNSNTSTPQSTNKSISTSLRHLNLPSAPFIPDIRPSKTASLGQTLPSQNDTGGAGSATPSPQMLALQTKPQHVQSGASPKNPPTTNQQHEGVDGQQQLMLTDETVKRKNSRGYDIDLDLDIDNTGHISQQSSLTSSGREGFARLSTGATTATTSTSNARSHSDSDSTSLGMQVLQKRPANEGALQAARSAHASSSPQPLTSSLTKNRVTPFVRGGVPGAFRSTPASAIPASAPDTAAKDSAAQIHVPAATIPSTSHQEQSYQWKSNEASLAANRGGDNRQEHAWSDQAKKNPRNGTTDPNRAAIPISRLVSSPNMFGGHKSSQLDDEVSALTAETPLQAVVVRADDDTTDKIANRVWREMPGQLGMEGAAQTETEQKRETLAYITHTDENMQATTARMDAVYDGDPVVRNGVGEGEAESQPSKNGITFNRRCLCLFTIGIMLVGGLCIGIGVAISGNKNSKEKDASTLATNPPSNVNGITSLPALRSSVPSQAPAILLIGSPRFQQLFEMFEAIFPDQNTELFRDMASPQYLALEWLANTDPAELYIDTSTRRAIFERYTAALLYFNSDGPNWKRSLDFLSEKSICQWNAMIEEDTKSGIYCNSGGYVTELRMAGIGLNGTVLAEIKLLTSIETIDFDDNGLFGPLPAELFSIDNLQIMWFFENFLTGQIPTNIGQSVKLLSLDLNRNAMGGNIPTEIGFATDMFYLGLRENFFDGELPSELGLLQEMSELDLEQNGLTGRLPSELGKFSLVENLFLEKNQFTGVLPTDYGQLESMTTFSVYGNNIRGTVPSQYGALTNLSWLSLETTSLTGNLDGIFCNRVWESFSADCISEVDCSCCTHCCDDINGCTEL